MALADRDAIMAYIAQDNLAAAIDPDLEFETHAENARLGPTLYKTGRVKGTREIAVRPNYETTPLRRQSRRAEVSAMRPPR